MVRGIARHNRIAQSAALLALAACNGGDLTGPSPVETNVSVTSTIVSDPNPLDNRRVATRRDVTLETASTTTWGFGGTTPFDTCLEEGTMFGGWRVRYHGYGCVMLQSTSGALAMAPAAAATPDVTHAPLAVGPAHGDRVTFVADMETTAQLRVGTPNPWEVAWLVWHYQDDERFYYFIPKPNGWELGKRDPAYPGGQRFLATGGNRVFPIGQRYTVRVTQSGNQITVSVNGKQVVQYRDTERPYRTSGRVAMYAEDAAVRLHSLSAL